MTKRPSYNNQRFRHSRRTSRTRERSSNAALTFEISHHKTQLTIVRKRSSSCQSSRTKCHLNSACESVKLMSYFVDTPAMLAQRQPIIGDDKKTTRESYTQQFRRVILLRRKIANSRTRTLGGQRSDNRKALPFLLMINDHGHGLFPAGPSNKGFKNKLRHTREGAGIVNSKKLSLVL